MMTNIKNSAAVNALSTANKSLLQAAKNGNIELLASSITGGADINVQVDEDCALTIAIKNNQIKVIKHLLENHLNELIIDIMDENGATPFYLAVEENKPDIARLLAENGANLNVDIFYTGQSAVRAAYGNLTLVKIFIEYGKDNIANELMNMASTLGDIKEMRKLASAGIDVACKDEDGTTTLMAACSEGQFEIANMLITEYKMNVHAKDNFGRNALFYCNYAGNQDDGENKIVKVINLLLDNGIMINSQNLDGESVLMQSAKLGYYKVVKCLIERDACLTVLTNALDDVFDVLAKNTHTVRSDVNGSVTYDRVTVDNKSMIAYIEQLANTDRNQVERVEAVRAAI